MNKHDAYNLTERRYRRITWDDVLTSDSLITTLLRSPEFAWHEIPSSPRWEAHPNMMFGGYYVSSDGDCYVPF